MDLIKEELERKRKALSQLAPPGKKFIKRGDLEKLRQQQYREEQEKLEQERAKKLQKRLASTAPHDSSTSKPRPGTSEASGSNRSSRAGSANPLDSPTEVEPDEPDIFNISNEEVVRRFRSRNEPIRLFGETDRQRIRRLRKLESTEERTEGQRNDLRAAMQATDKGLALDTLIRKPSLSDDPTSPSTETAYRPPTSSSTTSTKPDLDHTQISLSLLQKDPQKMHSLITAYLKSILREWEKTLALRPDDEKRSPQGKLASATQAQSAEYLKPFFKQLKKGQIAEDVVARITEICMFMQQREYLKANDAYLRMSIGNAPWPIGVTMVGIHERSAREKIFASQVAHVLNDEAQRKWIQTIKRMMTFAQTRWPPDDGAKMVG
ncbi:mRNA splicing protein prp18 [Rhizophlyctis rosea]|uniref:Pre-mRNA-splicing factor 18 n=1 Tax=Rhizophlyctis rosea TaxID=64517 RepID=A0AAD5SAF8_9FUNG|nr:mRNA splicing protein prp18 [Rhizophlyctis rosea]